MDSSTAERLNKKVARMVGGIREVNYQASLHDGNFLVHVKLLEDLGVRIHDNGNEALLRTAPWQNAISSPTKKHGLSPATDDGRSKPQ